jgi:hypothetical protein
MDIDARYIAIRDPDEPDDPDGPAPTWLVVDERDEALLGGLNPEEAQRIAACLNLARGIPTEELLAHTWQMHRKPRTQETRRTPGRRSKPGHE